MKEIDLNKFGYIRAGSAVPVLSIGNPEYNAEEIKKLCFKAEKEGIQVLVFPELSLTGYTCADLFHQKILRIKAESSLEKLLKETALFNTVIAVGMPVEADNQLFNCAVLFQHGRILGVIPKTYLPSYHEFYETRWYKSSLSRISDSIVLCGQTVPFHENILFKDKNSQLCIGIEICEDLWMPIPPSSQHCLYGANLILNLSASNEIVGKSDYRKYLVTQQSARCISGYVYASAGQSESTTDLVFSGHTVLAENGILVAETRYETNQILYRDIDIEKLMNDRVKQNTFMGNVEKKDYITVTFESKPETRTLKHYNHAYPFVPGSKELRDTRCKEIFAIQSTGLLQRLKKTGSKKTIIGISGGLDSTLALLATVEAYHKLGKPFEDIIGVTMPGFGTTGRTYNNSITLMKELGVTCREISIKDACIQHFKDIEHNMEIHDVTYENVQARERTQILMDIANQEGGFVVGTGDLSELALGWCTYNGDHMSMYAVNCGIPKTLVTYLVSWYADTISNNNISKALKDILDTPVSPELLPPDENDNIKQVTEDLVGPYELHDFFLYHMIRCGYSPMKIYMLAAMAFDDKYNKKVILKWLKVFYKRFFSQQFKRSCLPDGPKVGSICLSPRGDWRMPSDAGYDLWLSELQDIQI
jgi:NAD+ synthase (glutamine-hydrolysing)